MVVPAGWQAATVEAATIWAEHEVNQLNVTAQLRTERLYAEDRWRRGQGMMWFQHFRRAGGTSLCHLLRAAVPAARFLMAKGEACQPEDWNLRNGVAICEHNLSLLALDLKVQNGNAFAMEYGSIPGPELIGHRARRHGLRDWVFVASIRDPWQRFWSQLKYELATCIVNAKALTLCVAGKFEDLGDWWSPTAHRDSVLGIPGARISESPELYVDNYYTRILLNRTDVSAGALTMKDLYNAMDLLEERFSAVIIVEDFATSALQLACSLGLDLDRARPLLRKKVRPYEAQEALLEVPRDEAALGENNMKAVRAQFVHRNWADYALYAYARVLSGRRLAACARTRPDVKHLLRNPPPPSPASPAPAAKLGDPLPEELSVDDLFGCTGGSVELDVSGQFLLKCPRTAKNHADSWWSSQLESAPPKRKLGQAAIGAECWSKGFSWSSCCPIRFGSKGNKDCWDGAFNFDRCCVAKSE